MTVAELIRELRELPLDVELVYRSEDDFADLRYFSPTFTKPEICDKNTSLMEGEIEFRDEESETSFLAIGVGF